MGKDCFDIKETTQFLEVLAYLFYIYRCHVNSKICSTFLVPAPFYICASLESELKIWRAWINLPDAKKNSESDDCSQIIAHIYTQYQSDYMT